MAPAASAAKASVGVITPGRLTRPRRTRFGDHRGIEVGRDDQLAAGGVHVAHLLAPSAPCRRRPAPRGNALPQARDARRSGSRRIERHLDQRRSRRRPAPRRRRTLRPASGRAGSRPAASAASPRSKLFATGSTKRSRSWSGRWTDDAWPAHAGRPSWPRRRAVRRLPRCPQRQLDSARVSAAAPISTMSARASQRLRAQLLADQQARQVAAQSRAGHAVEQRQRARAEGVVQQAVGRCCARATPRRKAASSSGASPSAGCAPGSNAGAAARRTRRS